LAAASTSTRGAQAADTPRDRSDMRLMAQAAERAASGHGGSMTLDPDTVTFRLPLPEDDRTGSPGWTGQRMRRAAGWLVGISGLALVRHTGLSETLVGMLFTAVATSLPELVTTLAAVRQGSLTLAVGGIIGGNTLDVLFLVFSDVAYGDDAIYAAIGPQPLFLIALTILLTACLLLGLVRREPSGVANIGFGSAAVLVLYLAGMAALVVR
jgi:Ca2+/Na+ antiporter